MNFTAVDIPLAPLSAPPSLRPREPGASVVEVKLPMRPSQKWVAYACRSAGVAKPKWDSLRDVWKTTFQAEDGVEERIAITAQGELVIRVKVDWAVTLDNVERHTSTARRIVSAIMMAMQADVRRRSTGLLGVAPRVGFFDDR